MKFPLSPSVVALSILGTFLGPSFDVVGATVQRQSDGILVTTDDRVVRLQPWTPGVIRVESAPGKTLPAKESFAVIGKPAPGPWSMKEDANQVELQTARLRASVDKTTGLVSFSDQNGKPLLSQKTMDFQPAADAGRDGLKTRTTAP